MHRHYRILLGIAVLVILGGTVFFHFVEGWSWIDAYFFTVVTISTVGYGNLIPATAVGKIGTTVLIFLGLAVVAAALNLFGTELTAAHTAFREKQQSLKKELRAAKKKLKAQESPLD